MYAFRKLAYNLHVHFQKRNRFKNKIFYSLVIVSIVPLLIIGGFSYKKSIEMLEEQNTWVVTQMMDTAQMNLSKRVKQIESISNMIMENKDLLKLIRKTHTQSVFDQTNDYLYIKNYLKNIESSFKIFKIRIYINPQAAYANEGVNLLNFNWLPENPDFAEGGDLDNFLEDKIYWTKTNRQRYIFDKWHNVISAYRVVRDPLDKKKVFMVFFIDILESEIIEAMRQSIINLDELYVVDTNGIILSHKNKKIIGQTIQNPSLNEIIQINNIIRSDKNRLLVTKRIDGVGWKIVADVSLEAIAEKGAQIMNFLYFTILLAFLLTFILSLILSQSLSKRITQLANTMRRSSTANKNIVLYNMIDYEKKGNGDELDDLITEYNTMVNNVHKLLKDVYQAKIEETHAKLTALQAQINPHFLYNVLDSIKSCLDLEKAQHAREMVIHLSKFFRKALSGGRDQIKIGEELDMVSHYVNLQRMCYGNKFELIFDINNDIQEFLIVKLIVQPVIENAINHGLCNKKNGGAIHVKVDFHDDDILIIIRDNGIGISPRKLDELRSEMADMQKGGENKSYGLKNVNQRLKLKYGTSYGLSIDSMVNEWTEVRICIPQEI